MKTQRLKEIITQKSFKTGNFILASGAKSNYLFDLKTTLLDPEGANLAADLILAKITNNIMAIGGVELGACPIVSAVCVKSHLINRPIKSFYVRKAKKDRGTNQLIEGCSLIPGEEVIIVEDVTTTGNSAMQAVKIVREQGAIVKQVFSIVDRLEGAQKNMIAEGINLSALFTKDDFEIINSV